MYALFDIGGTKTRVAISRNLKGMGEPVVFDTPRLYAEGLAVLVSAVRELAGGERVRAITGGIRGVLTKDRSGLAHDDVLAPWQGQPLVRDLAEALDAPVALENDAALAALGEAVYGAGNGFRIVAYHTISTGVGGARVVDGKIDAHDVGFEPGHQSIDADQTLAPTAASADLEDYISGAAIERRFGKAPREIPQSDPLWGELARLLAYGLKNAVVYWSPEVIVLGGSMILGDPRIPIDEVATHLAAALADLVPTPLVRAAVLGEQGGLYGALSLLAEHERVE